MAKIIITSFYGSIIIENETVTIYTTEEKICDEKGNIVKVGDPAGLHVADLVFETEKQRFIFPNLYLGLDCLLEINDLLEAFYHNEQDKIFININKLCDFVDVELIGSRSIVIENKTL